MSNGDAQNDRIAGIATNSPSQWWDTWTTVQDNLTYYDQPLTTVTPRVDPELPLIDGTPIQFQDEFGVDQAIAYIEDLHAVNGEIPKDFWSTSTQKPFMITLGLHNVHGGRGYWCWDERTALGSVVPYANLLAKIATSGKNYGTSSKWAEGPGTQIYNETQRAEMMADAANGADSWKPWIDCAMTQLKWTDDQIGRLVDWLGPEGLANTLIIFTGDNGTVSEMLPTRHGVDVGTDKLVLDSAPYSVTIDSQGKGTQGEAGLNVPMILAHGPVAKRLYGTSSKARMNLADVVETLAHLSEGTTSTDTQYTPHGRDFSSLVYGTAADQDRLLGVTVSSLNFNGEVSAIHDPLPNGDIWRLHVMPAVDGVRNCMYIQNLALPPGTEASPTDTAFTNFRSEFNSEQADFEFIGAILDMIDEINCAYGGISSCRSNTRLYEPVPHEDWLGFEPNDPTAQCDGVTPFRLMPD